MNNKRRELLKNGRELLSRVSDLISRVLEEEQDCMDNIPENLQSSDRYETMEEMVSKLEELIEHIENADELISEIIC